MASPTNSEAIQAALSKPGYLPAAVTADFLEQSRDHATVIAILFVGTLVLVIMALRCCARVFVTKHFGLDDWLAVLTLIPYIAFIALSIILIHLGSGRHFTYIEYILDNDTINLTETLDFAAHLIYTTALLVCRLSGLAFYSRITRRHGTLTWSIRAAAVFMVAGYLPQLFLIVFHCLPVTSLWPYAFQPEVNNYTCISWGEVYVTNSTISLVCDLILFTIPATIIHILRVSLKDKLKLVCVVMPGLLVIAISVVRMYLVIDSQWVTDESWAYDPFLGVEVAEVGTTLIALSIPALKPFFGSVFAFLDRNKGEDQSSPRKHRTIGTSLAHRERVDPNADVTTRELDEWSSGSVRAMTMQSTGSTELLPQQRERNDG
ncbi:hypothetical protein LTR62_007454 [Meristemomyces frigidus]|uniref:Rhodopsin domain-containing protein n=1 Tax=Meristemomyces frigidus TaxID=1508187 RepID=A0AAN7YMI9_9PEZI|nr:hypothetical protein LTR62_007454 [Meristemomyces frigidus]